MESENIGGEIILIRRRELVRKENVSNEADMIEDENDNQREEHFGKQMVEGPVRPRIRSM